VQTELMLNIQKDNLILGSFKGLRDGKKFTIPLRGSLGKDNTFTLSGGSGDNGIKVTGKVSASGAAGGIDGKIFGKPVGARYDAKK
jgi:hypothetical protein